jgi:isocitrate lyase
MASNNMKSVSVDPNQEDEIFAKEVADVKSWWSHPRWRYTKRPFTAEQIVQKRGNLKIEYPSNAQAKKLWNILEDRFKVDDGPPLMPCTGSKVLTCPIEQ